MVALSVLYFRDTLFKLFQHVGYEASDIRSQRHALIDGRFASCTPNDVNPNGSRSSLPAGGFGENYNRATALAACGVDEVVEYSVLLQHFSFVKILTVLW